MPTMDSRFVSPRFPRAAKYHPDWIAAGVSGGANPLWMTEWLTETVELKPGMRVLDLGCGRALSSVFLRHEFGVQVWAVDLWFDPSENLKRIRDAGVEDGVFPLRADARSLPFATEFFDAILSIDSFFYYGTDDTFLPVLARFVKPGGPIGLAGAGLMREFGESVPEHLRAWWTPDMGCLHSAAWWRRHWGLTGLVEVMTADTLVDGWKFWLDWHRAICPDNAAEISAIEDDAGRYMGYVRAVCRRRAEAALPEPVISIPPAYTKTAILRDR
jgi:cyclopropane fatty-acyl-phospholipid synthase-like methyltransferase